MSIFDEIDSPREQYLTNFYNYPIFTAGGFSAKTFTAGRYYYMGPFTAKENVIVNRVGVNVTTGTGMGGDNAILGIYTDNNGLPDQLVGSNDGEVAIDVTAEVEATVSIALSRNRMYWMAFNCEADATISAFANSNNVRDLAGVAFDDTTTLIRDVVAYTATLPATSAAVLGDYREEQGPVLFFRVV